MNKTAAIRTLNAVISSGVTRTDIAKKLKIHPSQVSRIASGDFKRLDGNALRVCKYAHMLSLARAPDGRLPCGAEELGTKLARLMQLNPDAAAALSEMLDALIHDDARASERRRI